MDWPDNVQERLFLPRELYIRTYWEVLPQFLRPHRCIRRLGRFLNSQQLKGAAK